MRCAMSVGMAIAHAIRSPCGCARGSSLAHRSLRSPQCAWVRLRQGRHPNTSIHPHTPLRSPQALSGHHHALVSSLRPQQSHHVLPQHKLTSIISYHPWIRAIGRVALGRVIPPNACSSDVPCIALPVFTLNSSVTVLAVMAVVRHSLHSSRYARTPARSRSPDMATCLVLPFLWCTRHGGWNWTAAPQAMLRATCLAMCSWVQAGVGRVSGPL